MAVTLTILLFLSVFCLACSKINRCEKIKIPLCQSIGYNLTYMPNTFKHHTQEEAALEVHQFWPLVEIKCSPDLKFFLCSMYAPMCQPNVTDEVLPCRSICKRARKGCAPLMRQYGFSWPERMKCRTFPEDGGDKFCLSSDRVEAKDTKTTARPPKLITSKKMRNEKKREKIKTTKMRNAKKCEKIKIPMCHNIGYNLTYMPNMFKHHTQEEAALEVHQFWPLVEFKCSPDLKFFLCSMYAPMCKPNVTDDVLPCRSICKRARKGCTPLMQQYGFSWPERMKCRTFPEDGGDKFCLSSDRVEAKDTKTTARPPKLITTTKMRNEKKREKIKTTKMRNVKKCEKIKIPLCQNIGYNLTYMPNMFYHDTQAEAGLEVNQFWPLVEIKCSPDLKFFLCSIYAPMCQPNFKEEVLPCRSICERARNGCAPVMRQYGFLWPERFECNNFPEHEGDGLCLSSDRVQAKDTTTAARPTELITTTKMRNGKKCEKITIPMCQNIGYNLTYMPNMFNHDTQEEAALEVRQFWPLVKTNCSPDLTFFLCSVYAPECQKNPKEEVPPCRSICRRVRKGCAPIMRQFGFTWPKRMRCKRFPKSVGNELCLDSNGQ